MCVINYTLAFVSVLCSVLIRLSTMTPILPPSDNLANPTQNNRIEELFLLTEDEEKTSAEIPTLDTRIVNKLKARILHSLHLPEVPKSHASLPALQSLNFNNESMHEDRPIATHENTESRLIESTLVNVSCSEENGQACIRFQIDLSSSVKREDIVSSELWIYKKTGVTEFQLSQLNTEDMTRKRTVTISNQSEMAGWQRFDASILLANSSSLALEVSGELPVETGENYNPFLLIRVREQVRSRRSYDCQSEGNSTCCRKKVYLSFKDIHWDEWIVQPEGFEANFCQGNCANALNLADTSYARVMQQLCLHNPEAAAAAGIDTCVKCSPKSYKPISIIYLDKSGVRVVSHLPDMSVTKCACT
ncbi:inhibin beta E chain-like [Uloborus diversus]|uniref:inhibin beta E chain-like n=1 Tax=Uloborus diversus TaxID=327109 RepID=UPI00240975BD|nr:inhibin beta E chain-like [Uloborus diversus]